MNGTAAVKLHSGRILLVAVLIVLAVQALYAATATDRVATRGYLGPDSYMRMLRVQELFDGAGWYDRISERTNAPYGETLPWGRPLDAVLVSLAAVLSPFLTGDTAIYWSGLLIGPILAFLLVPIWSWGTRPFLSGGPFLMIFALSAVTPFMALNFQIGRPDHHGLEATLFVVQLCLAFRLAMSTESTRLAFLMGLAGGVMVWVSIMGLLSLIVFTLFLAQRFLRSGGAAVSDIFLYAAGLALAFAVALPIERPPSQLMAVNSEKLSIAHLTLALVAAATWGAICLYRRQRTGILSPGARIGTLLAGAVFPLGITAMLFPDIFLGPTANYHAESVAFSFERVTEFQPLIPTDLPRLSKLLIHLSAPLIAVGFIACDYRAAPASRRAVYDVLICGFAIYLPMALWVRRFALFAQVLALVPWVVMLARIMAWTRTVRIGGRDIPLRGAVVIAALIGPMALGLLVAQQVPRQPGGVTIRDWAAIGHYLTAYARETGADRGGARILLTNQLIGPEMVWRTPYSVIGAPFGTYQSIHDTYEILGARTDGGARQVIDRRGVHLYLYCRGDPENAFYRNGTADSFLSRVENGLLPDWLVPVPLPDALAGQFSLFRISPRG